MSDRIKLLAERLEHAVDAWADISRRQTAAGRAVDPLAMALEGVLRRAYVFHSGAPAEANDRAKVPD